MHHKITLQNLQLYIPDKNTVIHFLLAISFFLIPSFLSAQMKSNTLKKGQENSSKNIIIHQEINFKATPQQIYQTLLSSKEFSRCTKKSFTVFSDASANIDPIAGGIFSVFDGHIIGRILELVPNQRIVEAWRVVDWPDGVYSIAKFEFKSKGSGTLLIFDHIGFPEGLKEHLSIGWQQHYWDALNKYLQ